MSAAIFLGVTAKNGRSKTGVEPEGSDGVPPCEDAHDVRERPRLNAQERIAHSDGDTSAERGRGLKFGEPVVGKVEIFD